MCFCFFCNRSSNFKSLSLNEASLFSPKNIYEKYQNSCELIEKGFGVNNLSSMSILTAKDEFIGLYSGPVGHSWSNDPYCKGSFSSIAAGKEKLMKQTTTIAHETVKTLFSPINDTLYFVGEHTSIMDDIPGTMEAACESGERIARIISLLYCE